HLAVTGLGEDVDAPAGELAGEPNVLAAAADRLRELIVGDDELHRVAGVVDVDAGDGRGRDGVDDETRRVRVPGDDVDRLAAELVDDGLHAAALDPDAGADRIDVRVGRRDGDLRAVPRLAGARLDPHDALVDLGHLHLEQLHQQAGVRAGEHDLRLP